jgi:cell division protein FtsZ
MPFKFDIPKEERPIIKVIGVGGGGSNAVTHMFKQGIVGVDYAICNTDQQALQISQVPNKISLGPELTEGRGAGSKPSIGREACIESLENIKDFLKGTKMVFVTAGMGGGTGTGAAPIIAKAAKELDILTVGIVTIPFSFEGRRRAKQAIEGLDDLRKNVDSLIVVSNDKLREIHGNLALSEAFGQADNILTSAAKGIAEIITVEGYVNVDFEDVNTVMRDSGVAIMGTAMVEGEDRANRAIEAALTSPLLEDNQIHGAEHILLNITSGHKQITMDEIVEITDYVQNEAGYGTDLIWGHCEDENLGEKISVTVIATGFEQQIVPQKSKSSKKVRVPLENEETEEESENKTEQPEDSNSKVIEFDDVQETYEELNVSYRDKDEPFIKNELRRRKEEERKRRIESDAERREALRAKNKKLTQKSIIELENTPAYERRNVELDLSYKEENNISRYTISDEEGEIDRGNSYLHDNVD